MEWALNAEMDEHLGYSKYSRSDSDNNRNGNSEKQLVTNNGVVDLSVPRDREGDFEPALVKKRQNRTSGLDDKLPVA